MLIEYTNILELKCPDSNILKKITGRLQEAFDCYFWLEDENASYLIEFLSNQLFPKNTINDIIQEFADHSLYLQLISYNLPSESLEHVVYTNGKWQDLINKNTTT